MQAWQILLTKFMRNYNSVIGAAENLMNRIWIDWIILFSCHAKISLRYCTSIKLINVGETRHVYVGKVCRWSTNHVPSYLQQSSRYTFAVSPGWWRQQQHRDVHSPTAKKETTCCEQLELIVLSDISWKASWYITNDSLLWMALV